MEAAGLASISALLRIALCVGTGARLAQRGVLESAHAKLLGNLCKDCFLPALLLAQVGRGVTLPLLVTWWPVPVGAVMIVYGGIALTRFVWRCMGLALRLPRDIPSFALAAAAFPATTSVPFALLKALPLENLGGRGAALHAEATSLVLLYTLFMTILRWTVGFKILAPPIPPTALDQDDDRVGLLGSASDPLQPLAPEGGLARLSAWCEEQHGALSKAVDAPVKACVVGIFIGIVAPLRRVVYGPMFRPAIGGLEWLGGAYVPVCMLILGQELFEGFAQRRETAKRAGGKHPEGGDIHVVRHAAIASVLIVRLLVLPLLAFAAVGLAEHGRGLRGAASGGIVGGDGSAATLALVLLLESAGPPAINMVVMCALHDHQREEMAATMLLAYPTAFATLLLWATAFMSLLTP